MAPAEKSSMVLSHVHMLSCNVYHEAIYCVSNSKHHHVSSLHVCDGMVPVTKTVY